MLQDKEFGSENGGGDNPNTELLCDSDTYPKKYWDGISNACVTCQGKFYADKKGDACVQDICDATT